MEQFVLGIFQEQLSKFIINFRKEQVNANLLNGKGEIDNVELNCAFLNETLCKITPYFALESVKISKLTFHVTSWANLRKAPIMIDIEQVEAILVEPLHYVDRRQRKVIRQILQSELVLLIQQGLRRAKRGSYNLLDRILDNLTIEIRSIQISFQPCGKFKTRRLGPWTPPALVLQLEGLRVVSVNEYGQEAPPDEVWRHNHGAKHNLLIYKKVEAHYQVCLRPSPNESMPQQVIPLLAGGTRPHNNSNSSQKFVVQLAMQRRVRDSEWMGVQLDVVIPTIEVHIPQHVVPILAHALAGIMYCVSKDRAFVDPLVSASAQRPLEAAESNDVTLNITPKAGNPVSAESKLASAVVNLEDDAMSASSEDAAEDGPEWARGSSRPVQAAEKNGYYSVGRDRPVILLPNGIVIHDRLTFSVTIHQATIRGIYSDNDSGHFDVTAKGLVAEAIWPKVTLEKGGYVQASASSISIEEVHGVRIQSLVVGGVAYDASGPLGVPGQPLPEISPDESFPMYENRAIRPDPLELRHFFPAQAVGLKTTIDFMKKISSTEMNDSEDIRALHEVGVDRFNVCVDSNAWCRILMFALNERGGGFEPRWHTGDWVKDLTREMLVHPSEALSLEDCLQSTRQFYLDENEFMSSDLFNMTTRFSNIDLTLPAHLDDSIRSCSVLVRMEETMLVVSSALPRTFLSGEVGSGFNSSADATCSSAIDFPNDPSDIVYSLENSPDPSGRQRGEDACPTKSTFRSQLTFRGLSLRLVPLLPHNDAFHAQQFLSPSELTMIVCFEGETPNRVDGDRNAIALLILVDAHKILMNVDFDLLAGSIGPLLRHANVLKSAGSYVSKSFARNDDVSETASEISAFDSVDTTMSVDARLPKSVRGRRIMVQRQLSRSRETGALTVAMGFRIAEYGVSLWRQNVRVHSPMRPHEPARNHLYTTCSLLKVIELGIANVELGLDATFDQANRRVVGKACISRLRVNVGDLTHPIGGQDDAYRTKESDPVSTSQGHEWTCMSHIVTLGSAEGQNGSDKRSGAAAIRFEERKRDGRRHWSLSIESYDNLNIRCSAMEIERALRMAEDALLKPAPEVRRVHDVAQERGLHVPAGTIGALFVESVRSMYEMEKIPNSPMVVRSSRCVGLNSITEVMKSVVLDDVDTILIRTSLKNAVIRFPTIASTGDISRSSGFDLAFEFFELVVSKLSDATLREAALAAVVPGKGLASWGVLLKEHSDGLCCKLCTRQSLQHARVHSATDPTVRSFIHPFEMAFSYKDGQGNFLMPTLDSFEYFHELSRFRSVVAMQDDNIRTRQNGHTLAAICSPSKNDLAHTVDSVEFACSRMEACALQATELVRTLCTHVEAREISYQRQLETKKHTIDALRLQRFLQQKEYIAALSLVASQAVGWLRLGVAQKTGQRLSPTQTLWPRWAVLRDGLLIIYDGPDRTHPVDLICLRGARLLQMTGPVRKRDLKRAFALEEASGTINFAIADTDADYLAWIRALTRSSFATGDHADAPADMSESAIVSSGGFTMPGEHVSVDHIPLGRLSEDKLAEDGVELSKSSAKKTPTASNYTSAPHEDDGERVSGIASASRALSESEQSSRRSKLKNRFAGVGQVTRTKLGSAGQATKSRLGSAVLAARQKGREVAERRRQRLGTSDDDESKSSEIISHNNDDYSVRANHEQQRNGAGLKSRTIESGSLNDRWSCRACTFLNDPLSSRCQVCDTPSPVSHENHDEAGVALDAMSSSLVTDSLVSADVSGVYLDDSESLDSESIDDLSSLPPNQRKGMKARISGIRAAVQNARGDPSRISRVGSRQQRATERAPVKLRGVWVGEKLRNSPTCMESTIPPHSLKRLEGRWYVSVDVHLENDQMPQGHSNGFAEHGLLSKSSNTAGQATPPRSIEISNLELEGVGEVPPRVLPAFVGVDQDQSKQAMEAGPKDESMLVTVRVFCFDKSIGLRKVPTAIVSRSVFDLMEFHAFVSEMLAPLLASPDVRFVDALDGSTMHADETSNQLSEPQNLSAVATLRLSSTMLESLVDAGLLTDAPHNLNYHAEMIEEFLNSMLRCSLPVDALATLTDFLGIVDASTRRHEEAKSPVLPSGGDVEAVGDSRQLHTIANECQEALREFELCAKQAVAIARATARARDDEADQPNEARLAPRDRYLSPSRSNPSWDKKFEDAMSTALRRVMEERDQHQVCLVSLKLLHTHEIEREQQKVTRLEAQLESVRRLALVSGPFQGGGAAERDRWRIYERQLQNNSEAELASLCQQLSSEISARTAADLEIARLKELRTVERDNESTQRRMLQEQVAHLEAKLAESAERGAVGEVEAKHWRVAFEAALSSSSKGTGKESNQG